MARVTAPAAPAPTPPRGTKIPGPTGAEVALVMERAAGSRLVAAERLVHALPDLLGGGLLGLELYLFPSGSFTALARVAGASPAVRRRLAFWCARAGARSIALDDLPEPVRAALKKDLARCPRSVAAEPGAVAAEARRLFTDAGAPPGRPAEASPLHLRLEVGGAEWAHARWEPGRRELFVPGTLAPPPGDELTLRLRLPGGRDLDAPARVVGVRGPAQACPGAPPGFTLVLLDATSELLLVLGRHAEGGEASLGKRAHPRYAVRAPAQLRGRGKDGGGDGARAADGASGGDAGRCVLENLSMGGAFLRTSERMARGSAVKVASELPTGDTLQLEGEVVFSDGRGVGLRWKLDAQGEEELAGAVARVAAQPRRALAVDDDALARQQLADALEERGFEVLCAADGADALQVVCEEILSLDLLVANLQMPRMDGERLLHTIRRAGGESDLAIVMISGKLEPGVERKLESEGADAVLQKELGPRFIAQAAGAALERKRAARQA